MIYFSIFIVIIQVKFGKFSVKYCILPCFFKKFKASVFKLKNSHAALPFPLCVLSVLITALIVSS